MISGPTAATVTDGLNEDHAVSFRAAVPALEGAALVGHIRHSVSAGNVVSLYGFNSAGIATDLAAVCTLFVR